MKPSKALWVLVCLLQSASVVAAELKATARHDAKESVAKESVAKESVAKESVAKESAADFHSGRIANGQPEFANAGVVASFVDFDDGDLGESLSYLLASELTTTFARQPKDYSVEVVSLATAIRPKYSLNRNYHVSAVAIANDYNAPLTFWGAVRKQGDALSLSTFLTLRQELRASDLLIGVKLSAAQPVQFQAGLTRTRYEFAGQVSSVDKLFHRRLVTRTNAVLVDQPRTNASQMGSVAMGSELQGEAMHGPWYRVKTTDGRAGYIDIDQLKVLPPTVTVDYAGMVTRSGPGAQFSKQSLAKTRTELDVLDIAFDERGEGWYHVRVDNGNTWIDAEHAQPRFSLPAMHVLAGIYYMRAPQGLYACQFKKAAREFSQFIAAAASKEKNINLASAHQLYAASTLLSEESCGREHKKALVAYSAAVALTPYDTTAYNLRVVAQLGVQPLASEVVADLKHALQLDGQDPTTRATIVNLQQAIAQGAVTGPGELVNEYQSMYRRVSREHVARNIARIRQQQHLSLATKGNRVLPAPDSEVVLAFLNRSGAPLDIYVLQESNDPNSDNYHHIQLPEGDKTQLHVAAGTYEIAAEAPDPSVKSIYGEHTYSSPSQYELDFLVRLNDAPMAQQ